MNHQLWSSYNEYSMPSKGLPPPPLLDSWSLLSSAMPSDGSSLRLGSGSARARHLEGLLELGFCRLDPSIGRGQASGSSLRPQARARLELGNWRLDPSLVYVQLLFEDYNTITSITHSKNYIRMLFIYSLLIFIVDYLSFSSFQKTCQGKHL